MHPPGAIATTEASRTAATDPKREINMAWLPVPTGTAYHMLGLSPDGVSGRATGALELDAPPHRVRRRPPGDLHQGAAHGGRHILKEDTQLVPEKTQPPRPHHPRQHPNGPVQAVDLDVHHRAPVRAQAPLAPDPRPRRRQVHDLAEAAVDRLAPHPPVLAC